MMLFAGEVTREGISRALSRKLRRTRGGWERVLVDHVTLCLCAGGEAEMTGLRSARTE